MRILVTGGAGFMGSHLVDLLIDEGHRVVTVDNLSGGFRRNINSKVKFIRGDLQNKKICDRAVKRIDIIYHLAAHAAEGQSIFCPVYNAKANYIGFLQLIQSAINAGVKTFVHVSSMSVYGHQSELPIKESQPLMPKDPYGIVKTAIEWVLHAYQEVFGFNTVIIRPHNVYGERQNLTDPYRNVIGIFMNRILHDRPPIIYGDGLQSRAFTYIDDCTPYIAKAAFTKEAYGEAINIGSEKPITIKELVDLLLKVMGSKLKPVFAPERPLEVKHAYCSSEKAGKLLGYKTTTSIEEGLTRMAKWAKGLGPQHFRYWKRLEIPRNAPKVWTKKEL
jgi:UDP-glucose 4-epimerase